MKRVFLFLVFFATVMSCKERIKNGLFNEVFAKWSNKVEASRIDMFRSCKIDSTEDVFKIVEPILDSIMAEASRTKQIRSYLDSAVSNKADIQRIYVGVRFHEYLNERTTSDSMIFLKMKKIFFYKSMMNVISNKNINEKIARENFEAIDVRDSFSLVFPVENNGGYKYTFFYDGYPYCYDYSTADDSLIIKSVLEDKYYGLKTDNRVDSTCLSFKVRIVALSDSTVKIMGSKLVPGMSFEFCLQDYGRIIR